MNEETRKVSRSLLTATSITQGVILLAYLMEVIKGERQLGYYLTLAAIILIPCVLAWILLNTRPDSTNCRYIGMVGFLAMYTMVLVTGDTAMTFVYILVPLSYLIVCADMKLQILVLIWSLGANLTSILYRILALKATGADNIADYEIQFLASLLCMLFTLFSTRLQSTLNRNKLDKVLAQEEHTAQTLEQILKVADTVSSETNAVLTMVDQVADASTITTQSMDEISTGTTQTADSIQEQLAQTESIQSIIRQASTISESMQATMDDTHRHISTGMQNMEHLTESAAYVQQLNASLNTEMDTLVTSANQALDIIHIIQDIASQTNLLALNASIEAARAGEAGRGFAVVATEITNLAQQTTDAAANIQSLLDSLQQEASSASDAVTDAVNAGNDQNALIMNTQETFKEIQNAVSTVNENARTQADTIHQLLAVNTELVSSVETISAISEEVSATTQQAYEMAGNTLKLSEQMKTSINSLSSSVDALKPQE